MSVTITIQNNYAYCDTNNLTTIEKFDLSTEDGKYWSAVYRADHRKEYPFEMNLSNSNFIALWGMLGLNPEYSGSIKPEELEGRLNNIKGKLADLTSPTVIEMKDECPKIIEFGRSMNQVTRYYFELRKIASEAIKRNEIIVWG